MAQRTVKESAAFRKEDGRFQSLGDGKYGGFKKGVINGPAPSTKRGKARTKCKWSD
jgi:hypothetical protein